MKHKIQYYKFRAEQKILYRVDLIKKTIYGNKLDINCWFKLHMSKGFAFNFKLLNNKSLYKRLTKKEVFLELL